ncbi:hypothetical protein BD779DRAFT_1671408 [Infundibulicybe gibba]|nr:hypothetical protein BD779DRAFT_1671408 [Infundibulicybe gibba]
MSQSKSPNSPDTPSSGLSTPTAILHLERIPPDEGTFLDQCSDRNLQYSVYQPIIVLKSAHRRSSPLNKTPVLRPSAPTSKRDYIRRGRFAGAGDILSLRACAQQQRTAGERKPARFRHSTSKSISGRDYAIRAGSGVVAPDVVEDMMLAEATATGDLHPPVNDAHQLEGEDMDEDEDDKDEIFHRCRGDLLPRNTLQWI